MTNRLIGRGGSELEREVDVATTTKKLVLLISAIETNARNAQFDLEIGDDVRRLERCVKEIKDNANEALAIIRGRT